MKELIEEVFKKSLRDLGDKTDSKMLSKKLAENISASKDFELHEAFSPLRESEFNWYEMKNNSKILEIGAGYGAVTGLFLSKGGFVTAITEPDKADLLKRRYEGEKLSVLTTPLYYDDILGCVKSISEKYDYIVLEDAGYETDKLYTLLDALLKRLLSGGKLLMTVNNRFGLKYFLGAKDPYSGLPFDGVNGYLEGVDKGDRKCLSHMEIDKAVSGIEGAKYKFYYPVPDKRMPQLIFTDDYKNGINAAERLIDYNYEDKLMLGVEHRMFLEMIDDGALPFMANSFIVEITRDGELSDIKYAVTTTDRGVQCGAATTIREDDMVVKRPLFAGGDSNLKKLNEYTKLLSEAGVPILPNEYTEDEFGYKLTMPFSNGCGLSLYLKDLAVTDGEKFIRIFDDIFACIKLAKEKTGITFIDLAPCNAFYIEETDSILFYDQEFAMEDAACEFAMYRTIKYFYDSQRSVETYIPKRKMLERYKITDDMISGFEIKEAEFINSIRNTDNYNMMYKFATPDYKKIQGRMKTVARRIEESEDKAEKPYKVGYVPGVYDLFHTGHLRLFERCKARCEYLIVGVLTDELVEFYKGHKTVISYENRARVIEALKCVDEVIPVDFSNTDKLDAWNQLHYDCHFSGDDHVNHWNDVWEELKKRGSNMEFFSYTEGISSTQIRNTMKKD